MGIFFEQAIVVNRAPVPLTVRFDGQETVIPPGESPLPVVSINYAKNQNPIMGSADPLNPSLSGARYLIGVKGKDDCTPLSKEDWTAHCEAACRMDIAELYDDVLLKGEHVEVRGKGRKVQARGRQDRGVAVSGSVEVATAGEGA